MIKGFCYWENCKIRIKGCGTRYCKKHKLHSVLKSRIKNNLKSKRLYDNLRKMKRELYMKLHNEIQKKVLKELDEEEKR